MASYANKSSNKSNSYNLTEKETKEINEFLSNTLHEKELKFKRSDTEVACLTSAVKTIVDKVMTAIGDREPLFEISHKYLVGSMAEGTSVGEPDELDFLVVLKHFSKPEAIRVCSSHSYYCRVNNNDIPLNTLKSSKYIIFDNDNFLTFRELFLSKILQSITSNFEQFDIVTDKGKLSINSTTVCHHGPASVIKLLWKPTSETPKPLDILVDITPCIEKQGIHTVIQASEVAKPGHYRALISDDMYMLVQSTSGQLSRNVFRRTFTTTEVKLVQKLSLSHKMCNMILKYCFNNGGAFVRLNNNESEDVTEYCISLCSSYCIKTFVLRHAARCTTDTRGNSEAGDSLFTCLCDVLDDMCQKTSIHEVDGIFGKHALRFRNKAPYSPYKRTKDVIDQLAEIGKKGYSVARHEKFRKTCEKEHTDAARTHRASGVECHIIGKCDFHGNIMR